MRGVILLRRYPDDLTDLDAQGGHGLSGREAYHELVVGATADDGIFVAVLPHPDDSFRVDEDLLTLHIFKQYELHVTSCL